MPIYNSEKYLKYAIESVLNQTYHDFELILVDDGSKDGSALICDTYAKKDDRIKVIHQKNSGICQARNAGMKNAVGVYVGFIDNDDKIEKNTMEECHKYIVEKKLDWIKFGKTEVLESERGEVIKNCDDQIVKKEYRGKEILQNLLKMRAEGRMTYVWDAFFKRDIIKTYDLKFDPNFVSGNEDIDLCEQYAAYAEHLLVLDKNFYKHYTRMGLSASSKYSEKKVESYLYLLSKSNKRYEKYDIAYKDNVDYQYVVSKQVLLNLCQKLNDAGKLLSQKEKKQKLLDIQDREEMQVYNSMDPKKMKGASYKLYLYNALYKKKWMGSLLNLDKYSRKLVYALRKKMEGK